MRLEHRLVGTLLVLAFGGHGIAGASRDRHGAGAGGPVEGDSADRFDTRVISRQVIAHRPRAHSRIRYKGDKADRCRRGASLFASMNCDGCHGGGASGFAGPSLADGRWRYGGEDEEIFQSIFYGRPKGMPAFGGALGADGIWILVTYLQSLPVPDVVPTQSWETVAPVAAAAAAPAPRRPPPQRARKDC